MPFREEMNYYINLRPFVDSVLDCAYGPSDSNGLPLTNYGGSKGLKYNPTTIALYALGNLQYYLDLPHKHKKNLGIFNSSVTWLSKNYFKHKEKIYWLFFFDWPYERLKSPWYSGMAQGLCVSVLVRAYLETNNSLFLDLAKGGFEVLNDEIKNGGVLFREGPNFWIEEYPNDNPAHVLNGFIYSIFSLFDLSNVTQNLKIDKLLNRAIATLENNLKMYDLSFWSSYDLGLKYPASLAYQKLHVDQLKSLYALTGKDIFLEYANKWESYIRNPKNLLKSQIFYYHASINRFIRTVGFRNAIEEGTIAFLQNIRKKR